MQIKRHEFRELVNALRDVPDVQAKRELIVKVLAKHGILPEPVNPAETVPSEH